MERPPPTRGRGFLSADRQEDERVLKNATPAPIPSLRSYRAYFRQRAAGAATFAATVQGSIGGGSQFILNYVLK